MAISHRSAERFKYGICLNDECSLCKSKTVQQIPMRKDLVCSECGKPLRESLPPKSKGLSKPVVICIIAVAVILISVAICQFTGVFDGKKENPAPIPAAPDTTQVTPAPVDTTAVDTTETISVPSNTELEIAKAEAEKAKAEAEKAKAEAAKARATTNVSVPSPATAASSNGSLTLSYGKYTGAIKNGYPNGQGKLVYTTSRQINKYDTKGRMAQPGDYVQGVFVNGFFTIGKHYNSAGELIESINVGVADDVYESK